MPFVSERRFRVWDFNVSHKQMLVRSPASASVVDNIDLVFWGVEYVQIPTTLAGVDVSRPTDDEVTSIRGIAGLDIDPSNVHCIVSAGRRFFIVSSGYKVLQNRLDIFESSLEYFAATDSARDIGELLDSSQ